VRLRAHPPLRALKRSSTRTALMCKPNFGDEFERGAAVYRATPTLPIIAAFHTPP
jgi:hypothetical protein